MPRCLRPALSCGEDGMNNTITWPRAAFIRDVSYELRTLLNVVDD